MHSVRAIIRAAFTPLLFALWLASGALLPARVFAATPAGTPITHTTASISGIILGSAVTVNSNVLSPTVVSPVYGLSSFYGEASDTQKFSENGAVYFRFSVKNEGNTSDTIFIDVKSILYGKEDPGAFPQWSIQVCDAYPYNASRALTWQGSNSTSISSARSIDSAAVIALAGETKVFTLKISSLSGTREGANLKFNVGVRTASTAYAYTGFDGVSYGGQGQFTAAANYTAEALDIQAPLLSFDLLKTGTELTGRASIYGSANDTHFNGYSLLYGPGTNPTAWKEIVSSATTAGIASALLAEWDTATNSLQGAYTLKLVSTDKFNNTAVATQTFAVGNGKIGVTGAVKAGEWTMLSIPGVPKSSTIAGIFGTATRYEIQQWDPSIPDAQDDKYIKKYVRDFTIEIPGEGFWIKSYGADLNYSYDMSSTDTTKPAKMQLLKGWNQIGYPYDRAGGFVWRNVQVESATGTVKTMDAAISAGWVNASLWEYNATGYTQRDVSSTIYPKLGYFLQVYEDVKLVFDPNFNMPGGLARVVKPTFDWKLNLEARTDRAEDTANYVGQAKGASDKYDPMDSDEAPTVEPFVSLYFDNKNWGRWSGRYSGDARPPGADVNTFTFTVETSEPGGNVTLTVPDGNMLPENYSYSIKDNETGATFDPKTVAQYAYTDSGSGARTFTIVVNKLSDAAAVTISHEFPGGWSIISVPLEPEPTDVRAQLRGELEKIDMFQYYAGELYNPDSPEGVDIQSGIGYWLHLDAAKALDFSGVETNTSTPVEAPLEQGWNLIGNPYNENIIFGGQMEVVRGSERLSLEQAANAGWIGKEIYGYQPEGGGYERLEIGSAMEPWRGYAIMANEKCSLIFKSSP